MVRNSLATLLFKLIIDVTGSRPERAARRDAARMKMTMSKEEIASAVQDIDPRKLSTPLLVALGHSPLCIFSRSLFASTNILHARMILLEVCFRAFLAAISI